MKLLLTTLLLLTALFRSNSNAAPDSTRLLGIHVKNEGVIGGKDETELSNHYDEPLPNHGFFYNGTLVECSLPHSLTLKTMVRVWNEELSSIDVYEYQLEPEISVSVSTVRFETFFRGGYINDLTLGSGLTVKDLDNSGAIIEITSKKWVGSAGVFARGYGYNEDLYWLTLKPRFFPLELNALCMDGQRTGIADGSNGIGYLMGYLLPGTTIKVPAGKLYAEYGFKYTVQGGSGGSAKECPKRAHAGLVGFTSNVQRERLALSGCVEFRGYQKGFIPVTGIEPSRFGNFWDEHDSRNNWIDFFDSRYTSYWGYLQLHASLRFYRSWHLFFSDEMLYCYSRQKEAIVYPRYEDYNVTGAIVKYAPSTHFYKVGVKTVLYSGVSAEISVGNKLRNNWSIYSSPYTQWGQRFIASEYPFGEVRLTWQF